MTDTTSKPMWKRHKACNQRVFNDPIDWDGHLRACPAVLRADFDRFLKRFDALEIDERLDALEQTEIADPYAVADDSPAPDDTDEDDDEAGDDLDVDVDEIDDRPPANTYLNTPTTDAYGRTIQ